MHPNKLVSQLENAVGLWIKQNGGTELPLGDKVATYKHKCNLSNETGKVEWSVQANDFLSGQCECGGAVRVRGE